MDRVGHEVAGRANRASRPSPTPGPSKSAQSVAATGSTAHDTNRGSLAHPPPDRRATGPRGTGAPLRPRASWPDGTRARVLLDRSLAPLDEHAARAPSHHADRRKEGWRTFSISTRGSYRRLSNARYRACARETRATRRELVPLREARRYGAPSSIVARGLARSRDFANAPPPSSIVARSFVQDPRHEMDERPALRGARLPVQLDVLDRRAHQRAAEVGRGDLALEPRRLGGRDHRVGCAVEEVHRRRDRGETSGGRDGARSLSRRATAPGSPAPPPRDPYRRADLRATGRSAPRPAPASALRPRATAGSRRARGVFRRRSPT